MEPNAASRGEKQGRPTKPVDPFAIRKFTGAIVSEVRVERDADGKIVRVLDGQKKRENPLNDPLNELDSDEDEEMEAGEEWGGIEEGEGSGIVPQLEVQANRPVVKKPRTQTKREVEWLQRLVDKHGEDTRAMARDLKLNPMQQTEADISRRIRKWKGTSSA